MSEASFEVQSVKSSDEVGRDGQWSDQLTHGSAVGGDEPTTKAEGGEVHAQVAQSEDLDSTAFEDESMKEKGEEEMKEGDSSDSTSAGESNTGGRVSTT